MDGWLEIAASGPRLWSAVTSAAAGLWLSYALYIRAYGRAERLLALPYALAWLLIAAWMLAPTWRSLPETWHPPAVMVATDEGASYAALGAREAGIPARRAARTHYEALGFRVVEAWPGAIAETPPNLQAVLLWSDGRFMVDNTARSLFPSVPVFPVSVAVETREVQGESAFVAPTEDAARLALTVAWRAPGIATDARAELYRGGTLVWSGVLAHPASAPGARVTSEVALATDAAEVLEDTDGELMLIVRPARGTDNALADNDTVRVDASRLQRARQWFVRPLATLHERGLMDALRANPVFRVEGVPASRATAPAVAPHGGARTIARDVVWVSRVRAASLTRAVDSTRAVIVYDVHPGAGNGTFGPDARIGRDVRLTAFLPAGALRLADLGLAAEDGPWKLPPPDEGVDVLAWAEEDGRRGVLFGRDRARGTYVFAVPPLWSARFRTGAYSAEGAVSAEWVRGAATWASRADAAHSPSSSTTEASMNPRGRIGEDVEALSLLAARSGGRVLQDTAWPQLPGGQMREARARTIPLAPALPFALLVVALLAGTWYARKRLQVD